jgi:hypothetical protein
LACLALMGFKFTFHGGRRNGVFALSGGNCRGRPAGKN